MSHPSDGRADATRARLLAAAVNAFADRGFHATTTRDIAAAAGMSPAAVYVHHRSKEELLFSIALSGHQRTLSAFRNIIASIDDPTEQLWGAVHEFALTHARDHTTARVINHQLGSLTPEHLEEIRTLRRSTHAEIRGIVERGIAAGVFTSPDPAMTATALLSLGVDIGRWYRAGGRWSPESVAEGYADMASRILGADRRGHAAGALLRQPQGGDCPP